MPPSFTAVDTHILGHLEGPTQVAPASKPHESLTPPVPPLTSARHEAEGGIRHELPGSESHLVYEVEPTLPPPLAVPIVTRGTQLPSRKAAPPRTGHWATYPRSHSWRQPPQALPRVLGMDSHEAMRSLRMGQSYSPQRPAAAELLKAMAPESVPRAALPTAFGEADVGAQERKSLVSHRVGDSNTNPTRSEANPPCGLFVLTESHALCSWAGEGTRTVQQEAPTSAARLLPDQGPSWGNASS